MVCFHRRPTESESPASRSLPSTKWLACTPSSRRGWKGEWYCATSNRPSKSVVVYTRQMCLHSSTPENNHCKCVWHWFAQKNVWLGKEYFYIASYHVFLWGAQFFHPILPLLPAPCPPPPHTHTHTHTQSQSTLHHRRRWKCVWEDWCSEAAWSSGACQSTHCYGSTYVYICTVCLYITIIIIIIMMMLLIEIQIVLTFLLQPRP